LPSGPREGSCLTPGEVVAMLPGGNELACVQSEPLPAVLPDLYSAGIIPLVAPVATSMKENETFNVNDDPSAGAIAGG